MTAPAITVENLSKAYRLGEKQDAPDTAVGALANVLRAPFRNFRRLRRQTGLTKADHGDDVLWALRDVSFEVSEGEVVGVIGRNGAGKSTLLKILSRIAEPTTGRAVIRGRVSSLLEVGTGFHPELSGRENIYMNGTILGMTKREIDRKFDEIVDFSGVERFLDTPTKRYSSGMQVRLAFAVAAHLEPEILIIDEVLAVGDAAFQAKCLGKMQDVAASGRTVLLVSHNMTTMQNMCQSAIYLTRGQVCKNGNTSDVISEYLADVRRDGQSEVGEGLADGGRIIKRVTVADSHDNSTAIACGDPLVIRILLDAPGQRPGLEVGVIITDSMRRRIVAFHTQMQASIELSGDGLAELVCEAPEVPLVPGQYYVDVVAADRQGVLEQRESCLSLAVAGGDYFGTGRLPSSTQGCFALRCDWGLTGGDQFASIESDQLVG